MNFRKEMMRAMNRFADRAPDSADDVLESLGLQRRRSSAVVVLPALGTLLVGAAIGAAIGTLFGPRFGYPLMDRMGVKIPQNLRTGNEGRAITSGSSVTSNNVTSGSSLRNNRSDVHS